MATHSHMAPGLLRLRAPSSQSTRRNHPGADARAELSDKASAVSLSVCLPHHFAGDFHRAEDHLLGAARDGAERTLIPYRQVWDPNTGQHGIAAEIWGTLYTSILALAIGTAFGVAAALFLSEGYTGQAIFALLRYFNLRLHPFWSNVPDKVEDLLKQLIELLAAIPSVVYGLWGLFIVIPLIRPACNWLHLKFGWLALFSTNLSGPGVLPAVIVLAIMILPTVTAISCDALVSVPPKLRMAAYGLGATRWESIFAVILPTASRGIFGGMVLAFGRALGETMALAMLVGNRTASAFRSSRPQTRLPRCWPITSLKPAPRRLAS